MLHWVHRLMLSVITDPSLLVLVGGQVITALAGLVYGKLISVYIPPGVWGDYSLWVAAATLLQGLFVTPTLQSFKAALAHFPQPTVTLFYSLVLGLIYGTAGLLLTLWAGWNDHKLIIGLVWIAAVGQGFCQLVSSYRNALGQHRRYTLIQIGCTTGLVLGFLLVVVRFREPTITGLWVATALVNICAVISIGWQFTRRTDLFSKVITLVDCKPLIFSYRRYVWPLLSLAFWTWLINYTDRYLLQLYWTDADVGQYVMGYSLGAKLVILVAPLLAFLSPQLLQLRAAGQPSQAVNGLIYHYLTAYMLLASTVCGLFYLHREWIGQLLLSDYYVPAFSVGPIVALGYLFLTSIHLLELKWYAFGQTQFILWHNVFGTLLNIGFNLLLIPRLGILGAALATLLGYAGQFLLAIGLFSTSKPVT